MYHFTDRIAYTTAFVTPVVEHQLEQEIAQWVHHEASTYRTMSGYSTTELHLTPRLNDYGKILEILILLN